MSRSGTGRAATGGKGSGGAKSGQRGAEAPRSRSFGQLLRKLRESHSVRGIPAAEGKSRGTTAVMLVDALQQAGYPLSGAAYSEIENGLTFPRDATAFIAAVVAALGLSEEERLTLEAALAYDVVYARLGARAEVVLAPEVARQLSARQPTAFGVVLRQCRDREGVTPAQLAERLLAAGLPLGPSGNAGADGSTDRSADHGADRVEWLAAHIEHVENATPSDLWPLPCSTQDFIRSVAVCLRRPFEVEKRLAVAAGLDALASL